MLARKKGSNTQRQKGASKKNDKQIAIERAEPDRIS